MSDVIELKTGNTSDIRAQVPGRLSEIKSCVTCRSWVGPAAPGGAHTCRQTRSAPVQTVDDEHPVELPGGLKIPRVGQRFTAAHAEFAYHHFADEQGHCKVWTPKTPEIAKMFGVDPPPVESEEDEFVAKAEEVQPARRRIGPDLSLVFVAATMVSVLWHFIWKMTE